MLRPSPLDEDPLAGQGIGWFNELTTVDDIMQKLVTEAEDVLAS